MRRAGPEELEGSEGKIQIYAFLDERSTVTLLEDKSYNRFGRWKGTTLYAVDEQSNPDRITFQMSNFTN